MARSHVIRYVFKSVRATWQLVGALVLGLLAAALLLSTVWRWRYESNLRDAIEQLATGQGDPIAIFEEARASRPDDLLPHLELGQYLLDRGVRLAQEADAKGGEPDYATAKKSLKGAIKAFDDACELREKLNAPSSESAPVGACYACIALADLTAAERASILEDAAKALDGARDKDDADVTIAQAALSWARGELVPCSQRLSDASTKLGSASRGAVGTYYWHKALIELLDKDPASVDDLRRSAYFRPGFSTGKALSFAIRVAAAHPACQPKSTADLEARLNDLVEFLSQRIRNVQRYEMGAADEAMAWNAVGLGWLKVPNGQKAVDCFQKAHNLDPSVLLYQVNGAFAVRAKADGPLPGNLTREQAQRNFDVVCFTAVYDLARANNPNKDTPAQKEARDKYIRDILMTALAICSNAQKENPTILSAIFLAHDRYGLDDAEFFRTKGAFEDSIHQMPEAILDYRKAIDLGHRDSFKMEERIRMWETRNR